MAIEADIIDALPHRDPFRFLSSVDQIEHGRSGRGVWRVTGREGFFAGHFPGRPIVPGVLLGEALAQLAGLVGIHGSGADGRLAHVDLRFDRAVTPPAEVMLHAILSRVMGSLSQYEVRAEVAGEVVARGTLTLAAVVEPARGEAAR